MIESEYYVPKSLTAPSTAYQVPMNLPITVQGNQAHGEETFTISTVYDGAEHSKVFWLELRDQVHKLDEILAQSHFGTIEDEDLTQLELGIENAHVISAADVRLSQNGNKHGRRISLRQRRHISNNFNAYIGEPFFHQTEEACFQYQRFSKTTHFFDSCHLFERK